MDNNDLNNGQANSNSTYEINNANQAQTNPSVMKSQANLGEKIKANSATDNLNKEEAMEKAKYVLKTNEAVLVEVEKKLSLAIFKWCVWTVVAIIILGSLLFKDNLFAELSGTSKFLLIGLVITALFKGNKKEYVPSPMELQFYEDHLIQYLPKRKWGRGYSKMIDRIDYSDAVRCELLTKSQRIHIYGNGRSIRYDYKKDGNLEDKPARDKVVQGGMIYFNISLTKDVDFVKEIEEHSPIKVNIVDR